MRAERQLFEHTAALMGAALFVLEADVAQGLDVQVMRQSEVDLTQYDVLAFHGGAAVIETVSPFRMSVTKSQHEEIVERCERHFSPPFAVGQ